ncbi:hypothetical protein PFISCL1PPCAC_27990, partial [Pristionchus fissidentatus]
EYFHQRTKGEAVLSRNKVAERTEEEKAREHCRAVVHLPHSSHRGRDAICLLRNALCWQRSANTHPAGTKQKSRRKIHRQWIQKNVVTATSGTPVSSLCRRSFLLLSDLIFC